MSQDTGYTLGRVGMKMRGTYSANATYEPLDVVQYRGSSYVALEQTSGNPPTDTAKWMLLALGAVSDLQTMEQPTGAAWIDGSPILRYTIAGVTTACNSVVALGSLPEGVMRVIDVRGVIGWPHLRDFRPIVSAYYENMGTLSTIICWGDTVNLALGAEWGNVPKAFHVTVDYIRTTADRYLVPLLQSDNDQGCSISASTVYQVNAHDAWRAFNGDYSNHWATTDADSDRWIQIQMPHALKNITVALSDTMYAQEANSAIAGEFLGSNNGTNWMQIGEFANRPTMKNYNTTWHALNNSMAYSYLRVHITQSRAASWVGFSDIRISGDIAQ